MLTRLFIYMLLQTAANVLSQATLKIAMQNISNFQWTWPCFSQQILLNGWLWIAIVLIIVANVAWLYILKVFPFSYAFPLTALGFVFSLIVSIFLLHETVIWTQWVGVALIMAGCLCLIHG